MKEDSNGMEGLCETKVRTSADPETGRTARTAGGSPAAAVPTPEA